MKTPYHERDYAYGESMLTLRTALGLTQKGLAHLLGVSRRAVGEWEMGNSYPKLENLKQLIALAVKLGAFPAGQEAQEIRTLWHITHQKALLDESWLAALLDQPPTSHLHILPPTPVGTAPCACPPEGRPSAACPSTPLPTMLGPTVDWGDTLPVPAFYGREQEQAQLTQWLIQDHCQVISILGMGGIGKSTLAINTVHQLTVGTVLCACSPEGRPFDVVFFRSLHEAPSCETFLAECLQVLAPQDHIPTTLEQRLNLLLSYLRQMRALLVLDNLECLLEDRNTRGHFRSGFEGYGWLLRRMAETNHQSCLLLTSREKPADLRLLEGKCSPVRSLRLAGLDVAACQQLIEEKGVLGSQQEQTQLINAYSGNPLALRIVGETIVDLFGGDISQFLASETPVVFGCITDLLAEQFARLSDLERTVLYWLAIIREPMTFNDLLVLQLRPVPRARLLEAIDCLCQRSLLEGGKCPGSFTAQAVVLEYVTAHFIAALTDEIQQRRLVLLIHHSLSLFQAPDHIREKQERLLLIPLLTHLQYIYPGRIELEEQLLSLLDMLRGWADYVQGYGPANLIALLRLQCGHLPDLDLSHLSIRYSY